jgi:hypothetical protein
MQPSRINAMGAALLCSALPWLSGARPADLTCYVSLQGAGNLSGDSLGNALAWQDGGGVETCLAKAEPGETIYVAPGEYTLSDRILWQTSGAPGQPIRLIGAGAGAASGDFSQSVRSARGQWPTVRGDRPQTYSPETADQGSDFIQLDEGVSHVAIANFNLLNFRKVIDADRNGNRAVGISNFYAENIRHLLFITSGCGESACEGTPTGWQASNLYILGVSKRVLQAEGVKDSTFQDIYADVRDSAGQMHWDDWPLLFHFTGVSENILVERTIAQNPVQRTDKAYDNGDCYTAEKDTANLTFRAAHCFEAYDAAFDLKGGPHFVEDAIALKTGNRAFRVWDGPVYIKNSLAAYDGEGEYTQDALGTNAAIWIRGEAIVENFTSLNSTRPFILAGDSEDCGELTLSDSLMVLDNQQHEDRSLEPQSECGQGQSPLASVAEDNVQYRNAILSPQASLFNSLASLENFDGHSFFSRAERFLPSNQIGFIWPENLPEDWPEY